MRMGRRTDLRGVRRVAADIVRKTMAVVAETTTAFLQAISLAL
jgi:hypothetical protein